MAPSSYKRGHNRKRYPLNIVIPFLVIALVFSVMIWKKHRDSRRPVPTPKISEPAGRPEIVLFFVADGIRLAREAREIDPCQEDTECMKDVMAELFSGPVGELNDAVPEGVQLNDLKIESDTAIVTLNSKFATELKSGSSAEMMAVYAIINTICINFPKISKVKLEIEGDGGGKLRHLDISEPLPPEYDLEQPAPQANGAVAKTKNNDRKGKQ